MDELLLLVHCRYGDPCAGDLGLGDREPMLREADRLLDRLLLPLPDLFREEAADFDRDRDLLEALDPADLDLQITIKIYNVTRQIQ